MSEQETVPAPVAEGEPEAQAEDAAPAARGRGGRGAAVVAVVALLLALAALAAAGWLAWNQRRAEHTYTALTAQVASLRARLDESSARLARAEAGNAAGVRDLRRALESLRTGLGRERGGWRVAEAEYLLSIANQRAQLSADAATAIAALQAADRRLAALADPAFRPVRERIAQEIAALQAAPAADVTGIEARLGALITSVGTLPTASAHVAAASAPARGGERPAVHGWRQALHAVGESLRSLVVVRRVDHPPRPMLAPDERWFLRQNLTLQLEAARLAVLRGEPALYRTSLETAARWLGAYFDTAAPAVRAADAEIRGLEGARVVTRLPDISGSLRLLRRIAARTTAGAGVGR